MTIAEREVGGFPRGGTGLRVAEPVRPVGERGGARSRTGGPVAGGPTSRHDLSRPGGRPVRAGLRPVQAAIPRSHGPRRPAAARPPLRLTRLGWCVLSTLLMAGAGLVVLALSAAVAGGDELELAGGSHVMVQPGDTVWSIATEVAGQEEDVRVVVDAIERLNRLEDSAVVPGQVLEVP